jgi:hypothetical protein
MADETTSPLDDPKFHQLPLKSRLAVMRTTDPKFAALSPKAQGTVLYHAAQSFHPIPTSVNPEDKGFASTGLEMLGSLVPSNIMDLDPNQIARNQILSAGQGAWDTGKRAIEAAKEHDYMRAGLHGLLALTPGVGPLASQAGEEYRMGQPGQATAHALGAVLPFILPDIAAAAPRGSTISSTARGAWQGMKAPPVDIPLTAALEALGVSSGHPMLGALGAIPKAIGAVKGAAKGFAERPSVTPPALPGIWDQPGRMDPSTFPGMNMPLEPAPVQGPTVQRGAPAWEDFQGPMRPNELPDLSPIPQSFQQFPSGRIPGPLPESLPPEPRVPIWQGKTTGGPISQAPTAQSAPAPIAQPQLLDLSQTPTMQNRMTPIQEANRAAHGVAQELELPGSPAGKSGHAQLSMTAKKVFGVPSWSMLSADQMSAIHNYLLTNKKLPTGPSDLLPK